METIAGALVELSGKFLNFFPKIVAALVIFLISMYAAGILSRIVRKTFMLKKTDPKIPVLLSQATRWGTIALGTILALQQVDFNVTAFLTGLGILGFTVGFAIQDVSKNFIAGILIILQEPFDLGDEIQVGGFTGKVRSIDLRATELFTSDGRDVLIPNASVFTSAIVNFTRSPKMKLEIALKISPDCDLDIVQQSILEKVKNTPGVVDRPSPDVYYHAISKLAVEMTISFWIDKSRAKQNETQDSMIRSIKSLLDAKRLDLI